MITVQEAKNLIENNSIVLGTENIELIHCVGKIVSKDIESEINLPSFIQSSMDGYAINYAGYLKHATLTIIGEIAAGTTTQHELQPHEAVRIFTGAALPSGADTIVMQEKSAVVNGQLNIQDQQIKLHQHVRFVGSDIKKGAILLPKNTPLTACAISLLASAGIKKVEVYASPKISLIITGNEMQKDGEKLVEGKIYESNSYFLKAALHQFGITTINIEFVKDDVKKLTEAISNAVENVDLIILTGGVSVGDYDFVTQAATASGVETIFHKVKQKPGKPLFFGKKNNTLLFGLPGNPSSAQTCFYVYVQQALNKMKACQPVMQIQTYLQNPVGKPIGLTHFLKGYFDGKSARVLHAQESYKLSSFAVANCLIEVQEEETALHEATPITIYLIP